MAPNKEKLKKITVHKLPYETSLDIASNALIGEKKITVKVTEGKQMQNELPGMGEVLFSSNGKDAVTINFKGQQGKGIWLNAFELMEWRAFED